MATNPPKLSAISGLPTRASKNRLDKRTPVPSEVRSDSKGPNSRQDDEPADTGLARPEAGADLRLVPHVEAETTGRDRPEGDLVVALGSAAGDGEGRAERVETAAGGDGGKGLPVDDDAAAQRGHAPPLTSGRSRVRATFAWSVGP